MDQYRVDCTLATMVSQASEYTSQYVIMTSAWHPVARPLCFRFLSFNIIQSEHHIQGHCWAPDAETWSSDCGRVIRFWRWRGGVHLVLMFAVQHHRTWWASHHHGEQLNGWVVSYPTAVLEQQCRLEMMCNVHHECVASRRMSAIYIYFSLLFLINLYKLRMSWFVYAIIRSTSIRLVTHYSPLHGATRQ